MVAILWALTAPVLLGFLALGVETGLWYTTRSHLQASADAGAMAAAMELAAGNTAGYEAIGVYEARRNGLEAGARVVVGRPDSGAHVSDPKAVQVVVSQEVSSLFARAFLDGVTVTVRSVATSVAAGTVSGGRGCILALDTTAADASWFTGNTTVTMPECDVYANSIGARAVEASGSSSVTVHQVFAAGGIQGADHIHSALPNVTGAPILHDPYESLPAPVFSGDCDAAHTNVSFSGNDGGTLSPGVYCGGLSISTKVPVTLAPGLYVLKGGVFTINGGATVTGHGVTLYLTGGGSDYAAVQINGGANVVLSAPADAAAASTAPYKGILFYQDRNSPSGGVSSFLGGATMRLTGVLYFPTQKLKFTGGVATGGGDCTQIVADTITFNGNSNITSNCSQMGITPLGSASATKVSFVE
ncbi:MAG: pilus assembly protein TadG-related protein [Alphaproteobacteria bacterium]